MAGKLESRLSRSREGRSYEAEGAQARALAVHDGRLPEEIREVVEEVG